QDTHGQAGRIGLRGTGRRPGQAPLAAAFGTRRADATMLPADLATPFGFALRGRAAAFLGDASFAAALLALRTRASRCLSGPRQAEQTGHGAGDRSVDGATRAEHPGQGIKAVVVHEGTLHDDASLTEDYCSETFSDGQ